MTSELQGGGQRLESPTHLISTKSPGFLESEATEDISASGCPSSTMLPSVKLSGVVRNSSISDEPVDCVRLILFVTPQDITESAGMAAAFTSFTFSHCLRRSRIGRSSPFSSAVGFSACLLIDAGNLDSPFKDEAGGEVVWVVAHL